MQEQLSLVRPDRARLTTDAYVIPGSGVIAVTYTLREGLSQELVALHTASYAVTTVGMLDARLEYFNQLSLALERCEPFA